MLLLEVKREVGNRKVTTTMAAKMVAARMRRKIRGQSLLGVTASAAKAEGEAGKEEKKEAAAEGKG